MKSTELIKLRLEVVSLLYTNGNHPDNKVMVEKARELINFISTGNMLKKPEVKDK